MSSTSPILTVVLQAAVFSALSTTLAQSITAYQTQKISFDALNLISFMVIAITMTPPNYMYQRWLEDSFPSKVPVSVERDGKEAGKGEEKKVEQGERLSKTNTLIKFCLDQSFGAMANTLGFIVLAGFAKGRTLGDVRGDVGRDFLPMLLASWRVWPTVTLLNLVVVPFDYRMVVGNVVGVCWGIYVTLRTM